MFPAFNSPPLPKSNYFVTGSTLVTGLGGGGGRGGVIDLSEGFLVTKRFGLTGIGGGSSNPDGNNKNGGGMMRIRDYLESKKSTAKSKLNQSKPGTTTAPPPPLTPVTPEDNSAKPTPTPKPAPKHPPTSPATLPQREYIFLETKVRCSLSRVIAGMCGERPAGYVGSKRRYYCSSLLVGSNNHCLL